MVTWLIKLIDVPFIKGGQVTGAEKVNNEKAHGNYNDFISVIINLLVVRLDLKLHMLQGKPVKYRNTKINGLLIPFCFIFQWH